MVWAALAGAVAPYLLDKVFGDGGNQTTSQQQFNPEFQPLAGMVAQRGMEFGNMPYTPYPYERVADFSPYQFAGMDQIAGRATQEGGLPQQAEGALSGVLGGGNWMGPQYNPYADAMNPYAGQNPYLENSIQNTLGDITKTYNQTVAPTMAANAYQSGSFGNSGAQEMETASRDQLQRNLGRVSGDMRMQDYGMQQNLAEQGLNRGASAYGQMMGLNQQGYDTAQGRMMQGLGLSPSVYGLGYAPGRELMGVGGQMQGQQQSYLDSMYGQFQDAQQWPFKTFDAMMAPFGRASGGQTTTTGPQANPAAQMMGGAMLGNQLYKQYQNPQPAGSPGFGTGVVNPAYDMSSLWGG
jgi:hypothetical protein